MKDKEFVLSNKAQIIKGRLLEFYDEEDVKEFIRRLKEFFDRSYYLNEVQGIALNKEIDKLCGDKLK